MFLIFEAFREILPANRAAFCLYTTWTIENIVSGLRGSNQWEGTDWSHDKLFSKFKDYVLDEERRLKTILRRLAYNIDQDNTLLTLTGGSRPEKVSCICLLDSKIVMILQRTDPHSQYVMPLLCLLLERVLWTMNVATTSIVSPEEFSMLDASIYRVISSMYNRCLRLQG